jgi:hypothetical protein
LAKLTPVGFLIMRRKARGMMFTGVSGGALVPRAVVEGRLERVTGAVGCEALLAIGTVDGVLACRYA